MLIISQIDKEDPLAVVAIRLPSDGKAPVSFSVRIVIHTEVDSKQPLMQLCIEDIAKPPLRMACFTYSSSNKQCTKYSFISSSNELLPINLSFKTISDKSTWKGDVIVLKHMVGNPHLFVHAHPSDLGIILQFMATSVALDP